MEITHDRHNHPHHETSVADIRNTAGYHALSLKKKLRGNSVFRVAHTVGLYYLYLLLGAFAKLRKATLSFVMFACLSVRMEKTTRLLCTYFHDSRYLKIFQKPVEKIQVSLTRKNYKD
jgi:hypothetical protein